MNLPLEVVLDPENYYSFELEEYLLLSSSSPQAYWFLSSLKEILDIWSSGEEILRY